MKEPTVNLIVVVASELVGKCCRNQVHPEVAAEVARKWMQWHASSILTSQLTVTTAFATCQQGNEQQVTITNQHVI